MKKAYVKYNFILKMLMGCKNFYPVVKIYFLNYKYFNLYKNITSSIVINPFYPKSIKLTNKILKHKTFKHFKTIQLKMYLL